MRHSSLLHATYAVCVWLAACGPEPLTECVSTAHAHAICGLQNPEDLVAIPNEPHLLISEFGSLESQKPGAISLLDTRTERITRLFPQAGIGTEPVIEEGPDWGSARCPGPIDRRFGPHGIDLLQRKDGKLALYAVNHGGRESVEIFELRKAGAGHELAWRGCVPMPEHVFLNDVAALPDGGFVTTHMFEKTRGLGVMLAYARALFGSDTGYVLQWTPRQGLHALAGTHAPFPNGIETTSDGREIFVSVYMGSVVRRIERSTGTLLGTAEVTHPDNLTWSEGGRLLVASHVGNLLQYGECAKIEHGACPVAFEIVAIDPRTMATKRQLHREGAPMGAGTAAIQRGRELFIGSFASDRMLRIRQ